MGNSVTDISLSPTSTLSFQGPQFSFPYPWIFGTVSERNFWKKKSKNIAYDVKDGTKKIKLYVHIECQFGLIMMLIKNGICQREGKYASLNKNICHFRGRYRTGFSLKIKNTDTFKNYEWLRSEFFSQWTVRRTLIVVTQTSLFLISVLCHFYIWQSQKV